jgi:hypothetical protein
VVVLFNGKPDGQLLIRLSRIARGDRDRLAMSWVPGWILTRNQATTVMFDH